MSHIITAITGASGVIYGRRFIEEVNRLGHQQTVLISEPGWQVIEHELDLPQPPSGADITSYLSDNWELSEPDLISYEDIHNLAAGIASGSRAPEAMVIIPCTMGTIARLNAGMAANLLERAFDVMLKEKKKLILVPRETPLNQVHLRNMLSLSQMHIDLIPAMPAFYQQPQDIMDLVDFVVGRVLEHLSLDHSLYQEWQGE